MMRTGFSWLTWCCWACVALCAAGDGYAQTATTDESTALPRFRRVYAPVDKIDQWPLEALRYVPVKPEEFERLVAEYEQRRHITQSPGGALLTEARYEVHLEGEVLRGTSHWQVEHAAESPAWLTLEPCSLALSAPRWDYDDAPPRLGLGQDGRLGVLVERSGELVANWAKRGRSDGSSTLRYQFELPPCTVTTFELELPWHLAPTVDVGVLHELATTNDSTRRWQIQCGGHRRIALVLSRVDLQSEPTQLAMFKQLAVYDLSPRGLELNVQFELDVHYEPLARIDLKLDAGLRLASVRYGEQSLLWTAQGETAEGDSHVSIELPEPLLGSGRKVRLSALAPLTNDRRWQLPGVRVEGLFWQEGRATLRVQTPLTVEQIWPVRCRQTAMSPLSDPLEGEAFEYQFYEATAGVEVVLGSQGERIEVSSGTSVELSGDEVTGEALYEFRLTRGERFELSAQIGERWIIDSIESMPVEALLDWHVETIEPDESLLRIELAEPLTASQPLKLRVGGRSLTPPLETEFRAVDLRLVDFQGAQIQRQLVSARATGAYQLRVTSNEDGSELDPAQMVPEDVALFVDAPQEAVFDLGRRDANWSVQLTSPPPRFTARLETDVTITERSAAESLRIECHPDGTELAELLVGYWPPRAESWRWSVVEDAAGWEAHRLLPEELTGAGFTANEEIWRIRFSRPRHGPFTLQATREVAFAEEWSVGLAYVPEAAEQAGMLRMHAGDKSAWTVENNALQPIPAERMASTHYRPVRATYRYEPARQFETAATVRRQVDDLNSPSLLVWSLGIDSRYSREGEAWHLVRCRVQNSGQGELVFRIPAGCEVQAVWVDGVQSARQLSASKLTIELPAERWFPVVEIHATTPGQSLGTWSEIVPLGLEPIGVPVLDRDWQVWLPPGYRLLREQDSQRDKASTGGSRLFGPLARGPSEGVFLPWMRDDWLELFGQRPRLAVSRFHAEELIAALGALSEQDDANQPGNWGGLLSELSVEIERMGLTLLVDARALLASGVLPQQQLPAPSGRTPHARGMGLLTATDLAVWLHPSAVVLTSAEQSAQQYDELFEFEAGIVGGVLPGPLSNRLKAALDSVDNTDLVSVGAWHVLSANPWHPSEQRSRAKDTLLGYRCFKLDRLDTDAAGVAIVRYDRLVVIGWGIFLAIVVWNWWRPAGSGRLLTVATVGAVVVALWVPTGLAPLASGSLLGLVSAIVVRLLRRHVPWGRAATAASSSGFAASLRPACWWLALLGLLLGAALPGHADENVPRAPYRVFIPIDENRQPTGDYYLVPEPLERSLRQQAVQRRGQPQDWLLEKARYEGQLAWDLTQSNLVVEQWRASYDVHVFEAQHRILIPLGAEAAGWFTDVIRLDGSPLDASIDEAGRLAFEVTEPGLYRLDIVLQPVIETTEGSSRLVLAVPPVPQSQFELRLPINCPPIELDTAQGEITTHEDGRLIRADLGPTDRLGVSWRERGGPQRATEETSVTELLWLKIQPGSVVLQARFLYEVGVEGTRHLQLTADPRLRMMPLDASVLPVAELRAEPGNPQTIHIELSRSVSGRVKVDATFLLTGASGIGNLRLPRLEAAEAISLGRRLAVSVDSSLHFDPPAQTDAAPWDVNEFRAIWGEIAHEPQMAYQLPPGDAKWSIATYPGEPQYSSVESLALAFDREAVEIRFHATISGTAGAIFQHELQTPPEMVVESVSVREDKVERLARWSRDRHGHMVVYLAGPLGATQELALRGRATCNLPGEMPWPDIRVVSCQQRTADVQIYRQPSVRIEGLSTAGYEAVDETMPWYDTNELGRLIGQYRQAVDQQQATQPSVRLLANDPGMAAVQITTLTQEAGAWSATVDGRLLVTGGLLDSVRLSIPPRWAGPFEVEPADQWEVVRVAGESERQLVLRPREAIADRRHFTLRAPVEMAPGERMKVPRAQLLGAGQLQRYVVVPTRSETQQRSWEARGAQPVIWPAEFGPAPLPEDSFVAFEIVGENDEVALETVDRDSGLSQVHLADIQLGWLRGNSFLGLATFDVEPAGAASCPLHMAEGCRPLQVTVDDVATFVVSQGPQRWQVALTHTHLPQRVQVLFAGEALPGSLSAKVHELQVPMLGELPVERTVWTIQVPPAWEVVADEPAGSITALRHELCNWKMRRPQLELGTATATGDRTEDLQRWYATGPTAMRRSTVGLPATYRTRPTMPWPMWLAKWPRSIKSSTAGPTLELGGTVGAEGQRIEPADRTVEFDRRGDNESNAIHVPRRKIVVAGTRCAQAKLANRTARGHDRGFDHLERHFADRLLEAPPGTLECAVVATIASSLRHHVVAVAVAQCRGLGDRGMCRGARHAIELGTGRRRRHRARQRFAFSPPNLAAFCTMCTPD